MAERDLRLTAFLASVRTQSTSTQARENMSFFSNTASSTVGAATNTSATAEKDIEVVDPPTDSISSLSFSSQADYLAVGSWDNSVRVCISHIPRLSLTALISRFGSMRSARMDRRKGRPCINTKGLSLTSAGTRYVHFQNPGESCVNDNCSGRKQDFLRRGR